MAVTRMVDADEFHRKLPRSIDTQDYRWAFERGDSCMANLHGDHIVGWEFATRHPTRVRPGVEFVFPDDLGYSYASFTHPDHRGQRLADARTRQWSADDDSDYGDWVWYINVANLESLAVFGDDAPGVALVGHSVYVLLGRRCWCFASRPCRQLGTGFRSR